MSRAGTRACEAATPFSKDLEKFSINPPFESQASPAAAIEGKTKLAKVGSNHGEESGDLIPLVADHDQLLQLLQLGKALPHPRLFRAEKTWEVLEEEEQADGM